MQPKALGEVPFAQLTPGDLALSLLYLMINLLLISSFFARLHKAAGHDPVLAEVVMIAAVAAGAYYLATQ
jgi:hypothetical protein